MSGLFGGGGSKMPPPPKPQRMPVETDPEVRAAAMRQREDALRRSGRLSTILTDQNQAVAGVGNDMIGSSGEKLGA